MMSHWRDLTQLPLKDMLSCRIGNILSRKQLVMFLRYQAEERNHPASPACMISKQLVLAV